MLLPTLLALVALLHSTLALSYLESLGARPARRAPTLLTARAPGDLASLYTCQSASVVVGRQAYLQTCLPNAVGGGQTCSSTPILNLMVYTKIADSFCICVSGGAITPDSAARLRLYIDSNGPLVAPLTNTINGTLGMTVQQIIDYVAAEQPKILSTQSECGAYPPQSTPLTCGSCSFTCNNPSQFKPCGRQCIDINRGCVSEMPARKRNLRRNEIDLQCRTGYSACGIPNLGKLGGFKQDRFECIDLQSNVESCGGCAYPLDGEKQGEDCTALPNTGTISCHKGRCVVHSCARGYTLVDGACHPSPVPSRYRRDRRVN